jgi:hypothetical protein
LFPNTSSLKNSRVLVAVTLLSVVAAAGCGDKDWGYVTGTVMVSGQPVGPGSLMFEPVDPDSNTVSAAIAHFTEDGKYVLKSAGNREGAKAGEYRVMIHGRSEEKFGEEEIDPTAPSKIPARYLDYGSSGLTGTIKPGKNTIDFDLEP